MWVIMVGHLLLPQPTSLLMMPFHLRFCAWLLKSQSVGTIARCYWGRMAYEAGCPRPLESVAKSFPITIMPNETTISVGHNGWPYDSTPTHPCRPCTITSDLLMPAEKSISRCQQCYWGRMAWGNSFSLLVWCYQFLPILFMILQ